MKRLFPLFVLLIPITVFILFIFSSSNSVESGEQQIKEARVTISPVPTNDYGYIKPVNENELWKFINDWKYKNYGYRYSKNDILCKYADIRSKEISTNLSHDGFNKKTDVILSESGFSTIGENLIGGGFDVPNYLHSWLSSPSHRKALESDYTHSCIKCYSKYCVQLFGK